MRKPRTLARLTAIPVLLWVSAASCGLIEIRSFDGTGNNIAYPLRGSAGIPLLRMPLAPADYPGDGSGSTIVEAPERANPRDISNRIVAMDPSTPTNDRGMTNFVWQWGQFVDHDLDETRHDAGNGTADIPVSDASDPFWPGPIGFERSDYVVDASGVRQQTNAITAFIDASNVYGSDKATADSLRTFSDGLLRTTGPSDLLPLNAAGDMFVAGDDRAGCNPPPAQLTL